MSIEKQPVHMDSDNGEDSPTQSAAGESAEERKIDFWTWVKSDQTDLETANCVKEDEMDCIGVLKEFPDKETSNFYLESVYQTALIIIMLIVLSLSLYKLILRIASRHVHDGNGTTEHGELDSWAADKLLDEDTVQKLKDGGITNLESLKDAKIDDLNITGRQRSLLNKGITELKVQSTPVNIQPSNEQDSMIHLREMEIVVNDPPPAYSPPEEPLPDSECVTYLIGKGLNKETTRKLISKEYDSLETLHLIEKEEVDEMHLSKPQKHLLLRIIEEKKKEAVHETKQTSHGQAFKQFLSELSMDETTIDKLTKFGMDSPEALTLLDKENLDIMQLSPGQRIILEDVIDKMRTLDEGTEITQNVAKCTQTSPKQINAVQDAISQVYQPTGYDNKHGILKEEQKSGGFLGAFGRWTKKSMGKTKTGIANALTYFKSARAKAKPNIIKMQNGMKIVKLPVKHGYEDEHGKVRKCIIGRPNIKKSQKTIMIVGATGAGKSTLIDGLCNYIFDTKWDESTRFQLIDEHADELRNAEKGQAVSQTEWITIYTINSGDSNILPYTLNLIDTPGFGDTRGIARDQRLIEQIASLFQKRGQHGIDEIDAVCIVAKAPDARLTSTQRYIFNSMLSLFGKDIEGNILVMITFADGGKAPVLEAINKCKLPYKRSFRFNHSALFANNGKAFEPKPVSQNGEDKDATSAFGKMFWDMGIHSFKTFFDFMGTLTPKSLTLTSEVLEKRQNLKDTLVYLEEKVRIGLSTMNQLQQEEKIFRDNENRIKDNKDFTYRTTKHYSVKIVCEPGRNVTHCLTCHDTCHYKCRIRDDDDKAKCMVMDKKTGKCINCKLQCHWTDHKNTGYYLEHRTEEVEQTLENKLREFQEATGMAIKKKDIMKLTKDQYKKCEAEVSEYVKRCRDILQRLREIALKPDPLSETEYIEELIQTERDEHKDGWQQRVEQLKKLKIKAETIEKVHNEQKLLTNV